MERPAARPQALGEGTGSLGQRPFLPPSQPPLDGNAVPNARHLGAFLCDLGTDVLIRVSLPPRAGRKEGHGYGG